MDANKETMANNIQHYMEVQNVNATEICKALGIKQNTFSDWVNAKTYPRIDKIEKMAAYFGVTKAQLVEPYNNQNKISETEKALAHLYQKNLRFDMYRELLENYYVREFLDTAKDCSDSQINIATNILKELKKGDGR